MRRKPLAGSGLLRPPSKPASVGAGVTKLPAAKVTPRVLSKWAMWRKKSGGAQRAVLAGSIRAWPKLQIIQARLARLANENRPR